MHTATMSITSRWTVQWQQSYRSHGTAQLTCSPTQFHRRALLQKGNVEPHTHNSGPSAHREKIETAKSQASVPTHMCATTVMALTPPRLARSVPSLAPPSRLGNFLQHPSRTNLPQVKLYSKRTDCHRLE